MIVYRELSSLEQDLGIRAKTLYAVSNHLHIHYRNVQLPKKSGGYRNLSVPDEVLKKIQRRIAEVLLVHMPISVYATAYRFGGSTMRNAAPHIAKHCVLKLDICHFFDSIRYSTVKEKAFPAKIYSESIRVLLSMLCYYRDALAQGAPGSPAITNIIMYDFDETVGRWCAEQGICYTRYCDDMTFSGDFDCKVVVSFVEAELKKNGFLLNRKKTQLQTSSRQQTVTGIVVNEKLNIPAAYRRQLRQEIYYCQKFGIQEHLRKSGMEVSSDSYLMQLMGKVNYVLQVRPNDPDMLAAKAWLQKEIR